MSNSDTSDRAWRFRPSPADGGRTGGDQAAMNFDYDLEVFVREGLQTDVPMVGMNYEVVGNVIGLPILQGRLDAQPLDGATVPVSPPESAGADLFPFEPAGPPRSRDYDFGGWRNAESVSGGLGPASGNPPPQGTSGGVGLGESLIPGYAAYRFCQEGEYFWCDVSAASDVSLAIGVGVVLKGAITGGGTIGRGAFAGGRLSHFTTLEGRAGILSSGVLRPPSRTANFALRDPCANGFWLLFRTGLPASKRAGSVELAGNAVLPFGRHIPLGPVTGWSRAFGHAFTGPGFVNISTGSFTPTPGFHTAGLHNLYNYVFKSVAPVAFSGD